jgi:O-antigen/teichoic acid export membrane protein
MTGKDSAWSHRLLQFFAASFGFILLRFAFVPVRMKVLTHFLSEEEYGALTTVATTISCLVLVLALGSLEYLIRKMPGREAAEQDRLYKTVVVHFLSLYVLLAAVVTSLLAWWQPSKLPLDAMDYVAAGLAFVAIGHILQRVYFMLGKRDYIHARCTQLLYADLWILPIFLGFAFIDISLRTILWMWLGWLVLTLVISHTWVHTPGVAAARPRRKDLLAVLAFGLPILPITIADWMFLLQDRYVLLHLTDAKVVGFYFLCINIAMVGYLAGASFLDILSTEFFKRRNEENLETLSDLAGIDGLRINFSSMLRFGLAINVPVMCVLFQMGDHVVLLLSNEQYLPAAALFPYAAPIPILMLLNYHFAKVLMAVQRTRLLGAASLACALLNLALDFWLIRDYGGAGAAIATVISQVVLVLILATAVRVPIWLVRSALKPLGLIGFAVWCVAGTYWLSHFVNAGHLLPLAMAGGWCGAGLLVFRLMGAADVQLIAAR